MMVECQHCGEMIDTEDDETWADPWGEWWSCGECRSEDEDFVPEDDDEGWAEDEEYL